MSYRCNELAETVLYKAIDLPLKRLRLDALHMGNLSGLLLKRRLANRLLNRNDRLATRVRDIRILSVDQNPRPSDIAMVEQMISRLSNLRDFRYD